MNVKEELNRILDEINTCADPVKKQRLLEIFDSVCEMLAVKALGGSR